MKFFKETRDFLKGASISAKQAYSPFLSAALLHFPDFKIKNMVNDCQGATLYRQEGNYILYLSVLNALGGNYSINELFSTIYSFLKDSKLNKVEEVLPLNDFLHCKEFYKYRYQLVGKPCPPYENISYKIKTDYIKLKKNRSYIRYLNLPEVKKQIDKINDLQEYDLNHYREQCLNEIRNSSAYMIGHSLFFDTDLLDENDFLKDCLFKKISPKERLFMQKTSDYPKKKFGGYRYIDNWHLTLEVKKFHKIKYEDIAIIGGVDEKGFRMHEDDFVFMSEGIQKLMERWNKHKKNL